MAAIDFGHVSNPGRSGQAGAAHLVNAYTEKVEDGTGKAQTIVYVCPGLTRWDSAAYTGACRGLLPVKNQGLFALLGGSLVQFMTKDDITDWGGLAGTDPATMAFNLRDLPQVGIVTGGKYYVADTALGTLVDWSQPNDDVGVPWTDFPAPESVCFLDRYFVFAMPDGKIYHSQLDQATVVDPLAFGYASTRADGLVRVISHRGALIALGRRGLEIWEDVGSTPFAFSPIRAAIEIGCAAKMSVGQTSEEVFWVDDKRIIRQMQGSQPTRVSTHGVERALESLTPAEAAAINGMTYWFQGHHFYSITSAQWTWEYDITTQLWHERRSKDSTRWIANATAQTDDGVVIGNEVDGRLYLLDGDSYLDGDNYFTMSATGQIVHAFPSRLICDAIEVDCVRGTGTTAADDHTDDPQMMLDWSDDGGVTWQGGRMASMGRAGESRIWVRFNKIGIVDKAGRLFRFSASAPVMRGIMGVDAKVRKLR